MDRWLHLEALLALWALVGCDGQAREAAPPPPTHLERTTPPPEALAPRFELATEAVTYEEDNTRHWLELEVTVDNPHAQDVEVDWNQLVARAGCLSPTPAWSIQDPPRTLTPGQRIDARASWSCQPPIDPSQDTATTLTVTYRQPGGAEILRRVLPVRVLPTEGLTVRFDPPLSVRPFTEPVPAHGGGWDVCAHAVATNATSDPIVYLPIWRATVLAPEGAVGATNGWLGDRATRLDPGRSVSGDACFRFYGPDEPDAPRPSRIRIEHTTGSVPPQELGA